MKSFYFFFVALILFSSACKKEKKEGNFSLLSYNVAGLPEVLSSSSPETYTTIISPLLNEFSIVHVQEDFCYHDSLILHNTHPYKTDPSPCVPDGDGLNTFSDYPILNFERIPWIDCNSFDCLTPKGFSYSRLLMEDGIEIDFYNLHCNAGGTEEDLIARRGNLHQLLEYIDLHSKDEAIIIMGDFNNRYTREGDSIRAFLDLGYKDLWLDFVRQGDTPPLGNKLKECSPLQTAFDCETVDKILYRSNDLIELTPTFYQRGDDSRFNYQGIDTLPLSDHAPLFANFKYQEK